ncbi:MAG: kynureninase [Bacteroidota bacterium]
MDAPIPLSLDYAKQLDQADPISAYREQFHLPVQASGDPYVYLCGNSLGCQPKETQAFLQTELEDWAHLGVEGHLHGRNPWLPYHEFLSPALSRIVGAKETEVVAMNGLTVNLHLMMVSFYRPTPERYKILVEADAFPSDLYAVSSQAAFHGYDADQAIVKLHPREGEHCLRTEDILAVLEAQGSEIALVLIGGVNYYTGQLFDIATLTAAAQAQGCIVGWDLAHAAGNVLLNLHEWGVDFACWCSYKYLNAGPGAVAGCFVHERHHEAEAIPRLAGWWGHDKASRFEMGPDFQAIPTVEGWQLSNAPILSMAALRASLNIFEEVGMEALRKKSVALSGYLRHLLLHKPGPLKFDIITPEAEEERGCQLSLLTEEGGRDAFDALCREGVICDWREPNVIRLAPAPIYNSFEDAWHFADRLTSWQPSDSQ